MSRKSGKGIDKRRRYMSYADKVFIDMCRDIIDNGTSTEGEKVRPVWEDGTSAYTIKRFGVVNRYDLSKEFPALTLRRTAIKSCVDELLWIWQKKSNNVNEIKKPHLGQLGRRDRVDRKSLRLSNGSEASV